MRRAPKCKNSIQKTIDHITTHLSPQQLQTLSNQCHALQLYAKRDQGAGMAGGRMIDSYLSEFFGKHLTDFQVCREGECDYRICGTAVSLKKISGKSTIALNWSRNDTAHSLGKTPKMGFNDSDKFTCPIMILNLKSERWWIRDQTPIIESGIYFIDNADCRNVELSSNNKTNDLINQKELHKLLLMCISKKNYIVLPQPISVPYSISSGFCT